MEAGEVVKRICDGTISFDAALSFIEEQANVCAKDELGKMLTELVRGVNDLDKIELIHLGRLLICSRAWLKSDYRSGSIYHDFTYGGQTFPLYALISHALPEQLWVVVCAALYAYCCINPGVKALIKRLMEFRQLSKGQLTDDEILLAGDLDIVLLSDAKVAQRQAIRARFMSQRRSVAGVR